MESKELKSYASYNLWANRILVNALRGLSIAQLEQEITSSFPSIIQTAAHNWGAEFLWLKRLEGLSPTSFPAKDFQGSSHEMLDELLATSIAFDNFVQAQDENSLSQVIQISTTKGEIFEQSRYQMIHHCINHSSYHRGQITTMCRQIGITDFKSMDYIWYLRTKGSSEE